MSRWDCRDFTRSVSSFPEGQVLVSRGSAGAFPRRGVTLTNGGGMSEAVLVDV